MPPHRRFPPCLSSVLPETGTPRLRPSQSGSQPWLCTPITWGLSKLSLHNPHADLFYQDFWGGPQALGVVSVPQVILTGIRG